MRLSRFFGSLFLMLLPIIIPTPVSAQGLKIAPLEYKTNLKKDEKKKGFIDISNPSGQVLRTSVSVQAFRQVDDNGGLQFYDDPLVQRGITTNLDTLTLKPREAYRIFFTVDGRRLPQGDVYAAVFFSTAPKLPKSGVGQQVRVGTLLSIVNQTPGERDAEITGLVVPFLQFTDSITGSYTVKNTGDPEKGFYPTVNISSWPNGSKKQDNASLVFGQRSRTNDFSYTTGLGFHRITASYQNSSKYAWVLVLNPGIAIALLLVLIVVVAELILWRRRKKRTSV